MSKTPNFRNPSTNPFSLELISSLQISRESLSVRGLPLARLILVGQMRKGRVVVKAGGGEVEWQMGSVSLRYPVISQPQPSPYYSFSDVTHVRQRINHPHPSPPSPPLSFISGQPRSNTIRAPHRVRLTCHPSSRVIFRSPSEEER